MMHEIIEKVYKYFETGSKICTDTRKLGKGDIFIALKGGNFNGNEFARKALEYGAICAVVDEKIEGEQIFFVENGLQFLQKLANFHKRRLQAKFIGITGTNGKTTTKELIKSVLSESFNVFATEGNLNNHIGVPLSILSVNAEHDYAIIEMGANHPGEIAELCSIAEPDYGVITNVGKAHLEGFGSFEGVKKTKAELYHAINDKGELVFVNGENQHLIEMLSGFNKDVISYGIDISNFCSGEVESSEPMLSLKINRKECVLEDALKNNIIETNLVGSYNFENVLAAVCIGMYFGVSFEQIKSGIENYVPSNKRSEYRETESNKLIVDCYNANPTSMLAALENFESFSDKHRILVLGDMLELGEDSLREHQKIVDFIKNEMDVDQVFLIGKEFEKTTSNFVTFASSTELAKFIEQNELKDALILIKGSRGIQLENIINLL